MIAQSTKLSQNQPDEAIAHGATRTEKSPQGLFQGCKNKEKGKKRKEGLLNGQRKQWLGLRNSDSPIGNRREKRSGGGVSTYSTPPIIATRSKAQKW